RSDRRKRRIHQNAPDRGLVRHLTLSSSEIATHYRGRERALRRGRVQRPGQGACRTNGAENGTETQKSQGNQRNASISLGFLVPVKGNES
ncbi:hypothetical protein ACDP63_24045, partial [Paracoccus sp. P2]|uniref:hypothetical protein n=1 Tax=Paracoccus sp. P2 TaxID=3248840 RepID=UPI00391F7D35